VTSQTIKSFLAAAAVVALFSGAAAAASYPDKPITILVPFSAGGNVDLSTRIIADAMTSDLGQSIVVQNRPGAGGLIAYGAVANATPDGYTLGTMAISSLIVTPRVLERKDLPLSSFSAIGPISESPMVLLVPKSSPYKTAKEFLQAAKQKPDMLTIGHSGNGTTGHVAILLLEKAADIDLNVIPYKGAAPALVDLIGQQLNSAIDQVTSSLPHIRGGQLRALAVLGRERIPELPDVPTLQELGFEKYDVAATTGLIGPAGLAPQVVDRLSAALNKALADPDVQARFRKLGSVVLPRTPKEFSELLQREDQIAENLAISGVLKPQ